MLLSKPHSFLSSRCVLCSLLFSFHFFYWLVPTSPFLLLILLLLLSIMKVFMEAVELKVEMVAIHEKRLRKCLSKIKGIEKVEVEVSNQKAVITGYVHKNKILKAVRRSGLKAEFWSAQNEILLNAYASGNYGRFRFNNFSFFF